MIIIRIKGGLGNQLFQYATGYAMSMRLDRTFVMDTSFFPKQKLRGFKLSEFNLENKECINGNEIPFTYRVLTNKYINKLLRKVMRVFNTYRIRFGTKKCYVLETRSQIIPDVFDDLADEEYIDGYYQSEEYFREYRAELLDQFTQNYITGEEYNDILKEICRVESIAIHVRRGDFIKVQHNSHPREYLLNEQYYHNALEFITSRVENAEFYWFSDDIEWVKRCFGEKDNYHYVTMHSKNPDIDEMMLMRKCKHIITANSTFSWWAAWLNENTNCIRICPEKRYGNEKMIPNGWIKIAVD